MIGQHLRIYNHFISDLYFIKGRLKFGNSTNSAPFPSVLIKMKYTGYNSIVSHFIERDKVIEIE